MLKGFLSLLLLTAAALPALAQTTTPKKTTLGATVRAAAVPAAATGTTSSFTIYDFNWAFVPNLPVCVSTNIACYDGFILTNTTTGLVVGTTSQIAPSSLSYSYSPAGGIPYGTTNFSLSAHGFDEVGGSITSTTPDTVSVTVKVTSLNGPTGLTVKPQ